ncbi:probable E3 ubiquitin-protein ligase BAH1-like [Impatiens glandulifera]|uniref:probable E3 ubiquitin-protein ligase BAH1-like n=1 Tax=Impatiens glandulifera TaxID=253017 RepID=UPI001FB14FD2|nr:probable E3 ubiquitin-protein ligase BAH1-like [Impatiens glandulifera]
MKFGEVFMQYLNDEKEGFLNNSSHVEYKRLKKVLKGCRALKDGCSNSADEAEDGQISSEICKCEACPVCEQKFVSELMKEASDIASFFSLSVKHLHALHTGQGVFRYLSHHVCFRSDQKNIVHMGQSLIEYVTMNTTAMRKILKKYDKVHGSVYSGKFMSMMQTKHIELLHSPWLIELGAFLINCNKEVNGTCLNYRGPLSIDLDSDEPVISMILPDSSVKLDYTLTCPICLDLLFNPYALSCGHLFCKSCACSSASVMIFEGLDSATPQSKCPVCREAGVFAKSIQMVELEMLLRKRLKNKKCWRERVAAERAEIVKQSKQYWSLQTKYMVGYS